MAREPDGGIPVPPGGTANRAAESFEPMPTLFGARMAMGFAAQFLYVGLYLPYFPLWLKARDLTPVEISTILSMSLVIRVLASGQVMVFADKQRDRANLLTLLYFGSALSILLYFPATSFWPILAVTLLYNLFFNPVLPLLDAITLSGVRRFDADYGKIRIWGSLVFILANLGGGALLVGYDTDAILLALVAAMFTGALVSLVLPRIGRRQPAVSPTDDPVSRRKLLGNRVFLIVLAASGLAQGSHAFLYGFGSIHWQSIGINGTMIGVLWAIGVVAEVVLFQFSKRLLFRFSSVHMIALGCLGGIIRWLLFPLIEGEAAFLILQILHGLSFGAVHIGTMHFIMESVPEENIGAAQGVGYVLGGVVMGAAVFASGPLYGALGGYGFWTMAALCLIALLLLLTIPGNQPQSSGAGGKIVDPS